MTIQEIRNDLRAIKYYYSKQKEFEKAAETVEESKIVKTVKQYNQAVTNALPQFYKVYVELYVHNNTQETGNAIPSPPKKGRNYYGQGRKYK